jgi:hypothetical protein
MKGLFQGIGFGGFMQVFPLWGISAPLKNISWRMKQKWLLALFIGYGVIIVSS